MTRGEMEAAAVKALGCSQEFARQLDQQSLMVATLRALKPSFEAHGRSREQLEAALAVATGSSAPPSPPEPPRPPLRTEAARGIDAELREIERDRADAWKTATPAEPTKRVDAYTDSELEVQTRAIEAERRNAWNKGD